MTDTRAAAIDDALKSDNASTVCFELCDLGINCAFQHKSKERIEAIVISPKMLRALLALVRQP